MSLLETTYQTFLRHNLLPPTAKLVVGVSGGADSLALLHLLYQLRHRGGWQLHAATLDHGLRGQAGADDVTFVVHTCRAWDIPVTAGQVDVLVLSHQRGRGIEETARAARYDFLATTARQIGARHIAVAHHADDQAETILLHLIRGSGLQGLSGMEFRLPLPGYPDLLLIRPLLAVTRRQIEAYCADHALHPRQDSTNLDTNYLRNRLRLETLPHLRQLNPQIERALLQMADTAALEASYLAQQLAQVTAYHIQKEDRRILITREVFRRMHPALQRRFIYDCARALGSTETSYDHILHALETGAQGEVGAEARLPGKLRLRVTYTSVMIEHENAPPLPYDGPLLAGGDEITVPIPGLTPLPGTQWTLQISNIPLPDSQPLMLPAGAAVSLRTRRAGDRFTPLGMRGQGQTLNKWLINHKIPQAIRDQLPLIIVNDTIAALFVHKQWFISQNFALRQDSASSLHFRFTQSPINT